MTDTTTEMLALADRIDAWSPEKHVPMTFIARERRMIVTALRASGGAYIEGQRSMQERAKAAQPGTAANPNENSYQRGKFDGVMEYRRAIASLPLEAQESDGGANLLSGHSDYTPVTVRGSGPSDTPTSGDAVREAITRTIVAWADDEEFELTIRQVYALAAALKPEAAPAGEVVAWQWRCSANGVWSDWEIIKYPIEQWRESFAGQVERGTVECRPLYATPPAITDAGRSALNVEGGAV